jgi:hypothetical protein
MVDLLAWLPISNLTRYVPTNWRAFRALTLSQALRIAAEAESHHAYKAPGKRCNDRLCRPNRLR